MINNNIKSLLLLVVLFSACKTKQTQSTENNSPIVSKDGIKITIPSKKSADFFKAETVSSSLISAEMIAPAQIVATTVNNKVILFSNPELTSDYTELLNHQSAIIEKEAVIKQKQAVISQKDAIIKQKQVDIERFEDLAEHGAATGKDVANAKTEKLFAESEKSIALSEKAGAEADLIGEKSLIIQHSTQLKAAGFNPETLIHSAAGNTWIIADISENQISKIKVGSQCKIKFTAYPNEVFIGTVNGIADVMDNMSHMTKVRIAISNRDNKLRSGMFALVSFGVSEGNFISIDKNALITVQGKNYVFAKTGQGIFERKEVQTGQQIGDRVIVFGGLLNGNEVVVNGAIQLKGLSFGY